MSEYTEHAKLSLVSARSQAVGEFIEWMRHTKKLEICFRHKHLADCYEDGYRDCGCKEGELFPIMTPVKDLLAEYYEIDQDKLEAEKQAMLAVLRELNEMAT